MPYVVIEDFRAGLDRRKMPAASTQGSLQECTNAHITDGGEVEKRLAFVAKYSLPPGQTYGLEGAVGVLYTFGSDASPAVPAGVTYKQLAHPSASAMNGIVDTELYDGLIFSIATYANGDTLQFYDTTRVADFDAGSATIVDGQVLTAILTFGEKMYGTALSLLNFSAIDAADKWHDDLVGPPILAGSGFINMSTNSAGSETLTGLGKYQNSVAVFSRNNIQIWGMDPDPALNVQQQVLSNIGTNARRSVVSFGEIDVFFLAATGVRSLRARTNSDRAGVTDVGTSVDKELKEYLKTLAQAERDNACATIDPENGRYILSVGARCYVFSHYPEARISAWSRYDLGFAVDNFVSDDGKMWARSDDTVYLYGGDDGATYDSATVTVEIPYIDGREIATFKQFSGFDIVCDGEWKVYVNTDPTQPDEWTLIAIVNNTSIQNPAIGWQGHSPVVKMKLVNEAPGAARLSKIIVHYQTAESD